MSIMDRDEALEDLTEEEREAFDKAEKVINDMLTKKAGGIITAPSPIPSGGTAKSAPTPAPKRTVSDVFKEVFTEGMTSGAFDKSDLKKYKALLESNMDKMPRADAFREVTSAMRVAIRKHAAKTAPLPTSRISRSAPSKPIPKSIPGVPPVPAPVDKYYYYMLSVAQESDGHASAGAYMMRIPSASIKTGYSFNHFIDAFIRDQVITDDDETFTLKTTSSGWYAETAYDTHVSISLTKVSKFPYKLKESATMSWEFEALWSSTD